MTAWVIDVIVTALMLDAEQLNAFGRDGQLTCLLYTSDAADE